MSVKKLVINGEEHSIEAENGWVKTVNGVAWDVLLSAWKNMRIENNVFSATDTTYSAWKWIEIKDVDYSPMQWPCPDGYHVPSKDEWQVLLDIYAWLWLSLSSYENFSTYFKMQRMPWARTGTDWTYDNTRPWCFRSCNQYNNDRWYCLIVQYMSNIISITNYPKATWLYIRPMKDTPSIPDSSWTTIYAWTWSAWIFYNSTLWLISASSDWTTWITIADKNLWATTVWNIWDSINETNTWKTFQWWNNYQFNWKWWTTPTISSTQVDASGYWPWNYYNSSTFITWSNNWSSVQNGNLRWWVTWVLKNAITNKVTQKVFERSTTPTLADIQSIHDAVVAYGWENVYINVKSDQIFSAVRGGDDGVLPFLRYQWCVEYDIFDMWWANYYSFGTIITRTVDNIYYIWLEYTISDNGTWSLSSFQLIERKITTTTA